MRSLRGLLAAVLVLSIGAGGLATAYAIFDAVVLDPFPYRAPDDLVRIWDDEGLPGYRNLAAWEFGTVGRHAQLLSDVAPFLSVTQRIQSTRPALSIWAAATLLGVLMFAWGDRLLAFSLAAPAGLPQPTLTVVAFMASGMLFLTIAAAAIGPVRRAARLQPGPRLKAD